MTDERKPVTIDELAERTGVHRNTIVRDIDNGSEHATLPAYRLGRQWMIDPDVADAYAEARALVLKAEKALDGIRERAQERIAKRARS